MVEQRNCVCIFCKQICSYTVMHHIFKTIFKRMGGADHPMGVCFSCHQQEVDNSASREDIFRTRQYI